jgi:hypothetical protein
MEMVKAGIRNSRASIGLDWLHAKENKWKRTTLSQKYQNYHDTSNFKDNFQARFKSLKQEIELYQNESQIWTVQKE